jgi:NAD(P) transhydrogenase
LLAVRVDSVSAGPPFALALDNGRELKADAIVVTAGRIGNTDSLALENAGLAADARGLLSVNEVFQTAQPHIRAAGDVIGFPALASSSMEQARLAMVHAFDLKYKQQTSSLLPYGIHTIPECSVVGRPRTRRNARAFPTSWDGRVTGRTPAAASSVTMPAFSS